MKITSVSARNVAAPLRSPTRISTREITAREYLLISIHTDTGIEGIGYAYAGTLGGETLTHCVDDIITPVIMGHSAHDVVTLWDRVYQEGILVGRRGLLIRALSAVDIALWDAKAKDAGLPLANYLGGDYQRPLQAYASGGYYSAHGADPVEAVVQEIGYNREMGFTDHKIKVGGLSIAQDSERVAAALDAIGSDGRLALDANNAYPHVVDALSALRAFERAAGKSQLWWYEEPLPPDHMGGHAALVRRSQTPIATGEIHQTRWDFKELISQGSADILQVDVGVVGGITEYLRVANAAQAFDLPIAPHWHANIHAHLAAAVPNTMTVEHFLLDKDIYNFERLLTRESRLAFGNGHVYLSDRPGLGIELDEDAIAALATNGA